MSPRPQRRPGRPTMAQAAATPDDLARAVQIIYAGGLADGRALDGGDGVYSVRAAAPLEVTDDGLAINLHDARWSVMLQARCSDELPLAVDPAEAADAGEAPAPSRADHRHAHAPRAAVDELPDVYELTLAEGAAWDPATATLTIQRSDYAFCADAAGHAAWTPEAPPANPLGVSLSGLVRHVSDGANDVVPCQRIVFAGGDDIEVDVAETDDEVATVTIDCTVSAADVRIGSVDDGETTVAPCDSLTFASGEGIEVAVAAGDGQAATVTVDCTLTGLPSGTAANQIAIYDGSAWAILGAPTADYQVLQRKSDDSLGWDYVRAH